MKFFLSENEGSGEDGVVEGWSIACVLTIDKQVIIRQNKSFA